LHSFNVSDLALGDRVDAVKRDGKWIRVGGVTQSGRAVVEVEVSPLAVEFGGVVESLRRGGFQFETAGDDFIVVDATNDDEVRSIEDAVMSVGTTTVGFSVGVR
jgi:Domain of unknown function (DUF4265)